MKKSTAAVLFFLFLIACATRISRREFTSKKYNGKIAYVLAGLSNLAYRVDYGRMRTLPPIAFRPFEQYVAFDRSRVFYDPQSDTAGFVAGNLRVLIVAFRGTDSVQNVLSDIQATQSDFTSASGQGMGRVHSGFYNAVSSVSGQIARAITELRDKDQPVLFTGHSLGGALATLAVARALAPPDSIRALYTFGAPRVGNPVFKENFDALYAVMSYRIRNYKDPVPDTPPELMEFQHAGQFLFYDADTIISRGKEAELGCSLLQMHRCVTFHKADRYEENARRNIKRNPNPAACLWPF